MLLSSRFEDGIIVLGKLWIELVVFNHHHACSSLLKLPVSCDLVTLHASVDASDWTALYDDQHEALSLHCSSR